MLQANIPKENSAQIAHALLLGQKKKLEPTIREAYTQAGVMHILAVSGLHFGIIYALFILLLKPLKLKKEKARTYLPFVILITWLYAFLAGYRHLLVEQLPCFPCSPLARCRSEDLRFTLFLRSRQS